MENGLSPATNDCIEAWSSRDPTKPSAVDHQSFRAHQYASSPKLSFSSSLTLPPDHFRPRHLLSQYRVKSNSASTRKPTCVTSPRQAVIVVFSAFDIYVRIMFRVLSRITPIPLRNIGQQITAYPNCCYLHYAYHSWRRIETHGSTKQY